VKANIILIGGGGHCNAVIDVIESEGKYSILGILDTNERKGETLLGYEIIGSDDDIEDIIKLCDTFHITIGHIKNNIQRISLFNSIKARGGKFPVIVASTAYVSKHAKLEEGTIIMHNAFVNSNVKIGANCILNTSSVIEHDSVIENHCHISTGAFVNGACILGESSFIGSNATLIEGISIGKNSLIGAGAVVIKNTEDNSRYAGNPAHSI